MESYPSVFRFTSPDGKLAIATVHSDDADLVCEEAQIGVDIAHKIVDRAAQEVARQGWLFCLVCVSKVYSPAKSGCSF